MVKQVLRLEGLAVLVAAVYFYSQIDASWVMFAVLLLAPDISMIGYLKDPKLGAFTYNLVHNYILVTILILGGLIFDSRLATSLGLILMAHIGADRLLGFGLKYPTAFKETHLQKV